MSTPWSYCEVGFGVDDHEQAWKAEKRLPRRWELRRIDTDQPRTVAIFRVRGIVSRMDGERVAKLLREVGAVSQ